MCDIGKAFIFKGRTMLNQLFDVTNFRKIFDIENRKGLYIEKKIFPDLYEISKRVKEKKLEIKTLLTSNNVSEENKIKLEQLQDEQNRLKEQKEEEIQNKIDKIVKQIEKDDWHIIIEKSILVKNKQTYKIKKSPQNYFLIKQLQYNLKKTYRVKTANRQSITAQLKNIIKDDFPKAILVADIESFYENIDTKKLLDLINKDTLLSTLSKKIISDILKQYLDLSNSTKGIPRGIGISSFLAEIYMKDIDAKIKLDERAYFYARYVDDIVAVTCLENDANEIKNKISNYLNEIGLSLNSQKTYVSTNKNFDFLGYNFSISKHSIKLSKKKIQKYKDKILKIFEDYWRRNKTNHRKATQLLIKRIKYITGNTKLKNNKSSILTGVYFSNNLLDDSSSFVGIDAFLTNKITNISEPKLASKLKKFTFQDGFNKKIFYDFSLEILHKITKIWKEI